MKIIGWLPTAAFALAVPQAWAAACTVVAQGVAFGTYNSLSATSLDSTGNVAVICDVIAPYTIALSAGNGSSSSRTMLSGAKTLDYNLFTDATRTGVWGDGSGNTGTVSGIGLFANHTVYGRMPPRQNAQVGSYSDLIIVTVTF